MEFEFVINYVTGERETGITTAFSLDEAILNIVDFEDADDIESIHFEYTMKHSASFERKDIFKILNK